MAHPHAEHRAHKHEKHRVHHITKAYAHGGAVKSAAIGKQALSLHAKEHAALHAEGHGSKHRMDRPKRAKGGKVCKADGGATDAQRAEGKNRLRTQMNYDKSQGGKWQDAAGADAKNIDYLVKGRAKGGRVGKHKGASGKTIVNVITGHAGAGAPPPMAPPMGIAGPPPGAMPAPPMAAKPPMAMPPPGAGMSPGGPPMPMRAKGGRVNQGSHVWEEGKHAGTRVQHSDGKGTANRPENLNRGKPVTFASGGRVRHFYARGGKIESPQGVAKETRLPGGSGGGEARLVKAKRAAHEYHGPD